MLSSLGFYSDLLGLQVRQFSCTICACVCSSMHVIFPSTTLAWHHIDKASEANGGLCWCNASPHFILLLPPVHLLSRLFLPPLLSLLLNLPLFRADIYPARSNTTC